jgi:hypothetical protein
MHFLELIRQSRWRALRGVIHRASKPAYEGRRGLRSISDSGFYPEVARRAAQDKRAFAKFKRNPIYCEVLEHVSKEQGALYLEEIQMKWPQLITSLENAKINDEIGDPIRFCYPGAGTISPTTLRYLKVACDLREVFGDLSGFKVVEIGGGYGGQCLLADMLWQLRSWTVFDLDAVLLLISRYLECHLMNSSYKVMTLNRFDDEGEEFDLAISNYAFSELPKVLQEKYVSKVLSKARRGYMNMNTGNDDADKNHMSVDELRAHFPDLTVLEEVPLTAAGNYTVIWGK